MTKTSKRSIQKFIFVTIMTLFIGQSYAMDAPDTSLEKFSLHTTQGVYQFHQVDFQNLGHSDYNNYIESTADFWAIKQMFGLGVACVFKPILFFMPSLAYDLIVESRQETAQKYKDHKDFDWFIYKGIDYVGHIGLSALGIDFPQTINDKIDVERKDIYTVGANLTENFRGKGLASLLAPLLLQRIDSHTAFENKAIIVITKIDNGPIHSLCQKKELGFNFLGTADIDMPVIGTMAFDCFIHKIR